VARMLHQKLYMTIQFVCFTLLVLTLSLPSLAQVPFTDADAEAIQVFLGKNFRDGDAGMVIGILDKQKSKVFGAGKPDNGTEQEMDGDTIFEIGSVTKVFTSLLAFDMERRGEAKLDDPVSKFLPNHVKAPAYKGKEITLRNLAAQDSGLPWAPGNLTDRDLKELSRKALGEVNNAYTVEKLYVFLSGYTLTTPPGTRFEYSSVGMALLGHVMELKTSETYETLLVNRICRPLKMESTRIKLTATQKGRLARGHYIDGSPAENLNLQAMASAGALLSTANDLLKFLSANLGFTLTELSPLMEEMQVVRHSGAPRFGNTAMPWVDDGMYHPPGSELLGHGGGGFGYLAFIGFDKKKRRGVVVLSNQMRVNPQGVGWTILQGMPLTYENVTFLVREIVGIGIALDADKKTGLVRITTVYPKSPGRQAGLFPGLLIQKINGASVEGKSLPECLGMIGGKAGTKVRLEIINPEKNETNAVELTRQKFITATGDFVNE
jgi:serine-type D-Ala-D-Ala carboxypeptidase/endopeptidase